MSYNFKVYDLGNGEIHLCYFPNVIVSSSSNDNDSPDFVQKKSVCNSSSKSPLTSVQKENIYKWRSVRRAKDSIYKLSLCNSWDYFCTFTFSKENFRYDYDVCIKRFRKWLNNLKNRFCPDLKYLFIVEPHKDGAYHLHGLMSNVNTSILYKKSNWGIYERYGVSIYNFGRCELSPVVDSARISNYITKYITKELFFKAGNKHNYFCSKNLKHPDVHTYLLDSDFETFYSKYLKKDYEIFHIYNGKNDSIYLSLKKRNALE